MGLVLTRVYLEAFQKSALTASAERIGCKVSDLVSDAVDAAILGITVDELRTLEVASRDARRATEY
jgi:hypothetical protein